jgi:processive 1,2-diacylglycerol beta-glucosyltransferase
MSQHAQRVLILSASYGAGHNQVSRALKEGINALKPAAQVDIVDFFQFVSEPINKLTQTLYVQSVRRLPAGYGLFYKQTGHIPHDSALQRQLNQLGKDKLLDYLDQHPADLIICTFPTPAGVLSELKYEGLVNVPVHVVITDYVVHSQWIHPHIDRYYVADPSVSEGLESRGIDPGKITVTGIPIRGEFAEPLSRDDARSSLDLHGEMPVVLVMAGAFSMLGGLPEIVRVLAKLDAPHQTIVIAGHNKKLEKRLESITKDAPYPVRVLGFVEDIKSYMKASDLLISKTGGITVSEALACGLPLVAFNVIPGQEASNCKFLLKNGAARYARDNAHLASVLKRLLSDDAARVRMANAARSLARPNAAGDVAAAVLASSVDPTPDLELTDARA